MKYRELFKLYNLKNLNQNKWSMFFIALSIVITMTVSLILPQIRMSKQEYINQAMQESNPADLVVTQSFPSKSFDKAISTYEQEGIQTSYVHSAPVYLKNENNQMMLYLLSGYENLSEDEVVISEGLANKQHLNVGDTIHLIGIKEQDKALKITRIEYLPIDVVDDAQVSGYIKTNNLESSYHSDAGLVFISGKSGELLKQELQSLESGYKYKTIEDRRNELFSDLDKQIMALNLISTVGYLLAIAVLISGITMLIVRSQKDIAALMLIPIKMKDIIKAMKLEINILIFTPLILSVIFSIPLAKMILAAENISVNYTAAYMINILKFVVFNIFVFLLYRNVALKYMVNLDPVLIVKGDHGLPNRNRLRNFGIMLSLPVVFSVYAVLLGSGTSMASNFILLITLCAIFIGILLLIELITRLPVWKYHRSTLYTFKEIKKNKLVFVIGILNLTMMLWFILIGFGLANTLKESVDMGYQQSLPYNYLMKTSDEEALSKVLINSGDIKAFTIMHYMDAKIENDKVSNKQVRINEIDQKNYTSKFKMTEGQDVFEGNPREILISKAYADAYKINIGNTLEITNEEKTVNYRVKGTYDSAGINNNWMLKASENQYSDTIYLVRAVDDGFLNEVKDSYIANMNVVGDYLLSKMDSFLTSFKYICFLFIVAAVIFNVNLLSLMNDLNRKEYAIIRSLGIGKKILVKQFVIKAIISIICSLTMSLVLFSVVISVAVSAISKGNVIIDGSMYGFIIFISVLFVLVGNISLFSRKYNDLEVIRE
jgi:putative ABC transport system permease protein